MYHPQFIRILSPPLPALEICWISESLVIGIVLLCIVVDYQMSQNQYPVGDLGSAYGPTTSCCGIHWQDLWRTISR